MSEYQPTPDRHRSARWLVTVAAVTMLGYLGVLALLESRDMTTAMRQASPGAIAAAMSSTTVYGSSGGIGIFSGWGTGLRR